MSAATVLYDAPGPKARRRSVMISIVGLLVDAVSDILTVTDDDIQPTPEIASDLERSFARGILGVRSLTPQR